MTRSVTQKGPLSSNSRNWKEGGPGTDQEEEGVRPTPCQTLPLGGPVGHLSRQTQPGTVIPAHTHVGPQCQQEEQTGTQGCQECTRSLGTDQASRALNTSGENRGALASEAL